MAHRRALSSRHINMGKLAVSIDSPPLTPPLEMINSFHYSAPPAPKPKQYWQRTTFLALFCLIIVSVYVLLVSQPSLAPIALNDGNRSIHSVASQRLSKLSSEAYRLAALHRKRPKGTSSATVASKAVQLTPEQELAAVTDFLASLPQNVIPSSVNPAIPLDPQLVLDFDPHSPQAEEAIKDLVHDAWTRYPVVLYSKVRRVANSSAFRCQLIVPVPADALTGFTRAEADVAGHEPAAVARHH